MTAQSLPEANRWDQEVVDGFRAFWKARKEVVHLGQSYRPPTQRDAIISGTFLAMRAAARRILAVAEKASTELAPVARFAEAILDAIPPRADLEVLTELFFRGGLNRPMIEADQACARWRNKKPPTAMPLQEHVTASTTLTPEYLRVLILIRDQGPITNEKIGQAWIPEYGQLGEDAVRKRWTGELSRRDLIEESRAGRTRGWTCTQAGHAAISASEKGTGT